MNDGPLTAPRRPLATYRLQFNRDFGFEQARQIISYLHDLGVSDIYAAPYFKARPGSSHGYDVVDPNALNPEVGSAAEYDALIEELHRHGLGQLLDIVPNHMCIESSENLWWMDLLENGPSSLHAGFFDIDWTPVKRELRDKVLCPILGDQYGAVLERGELSLVFLDGAFCLDYYEHRLPIMPKSYSAILTHRLEPLEQELGAEELHYQELLSIDTALRNLPPHTERDPERIAERCREKEIVKRRLAALYGECDQIRAHIDENVRIFNGQVGVSASFDLLDALLQRQVYRLSHWRVATEEINYRRFFDINALAAIRVEEPEVFAESHRFIFRLIREGRVNGLRVDHLDGLYDPVDYLNQLQRECFLQDNLRALEQAAGQPLTEAEEGEWSERLRQRYAELQREQPGFKPFFIVGEKILMEDEQLPEGWPIFSTTGYEFLNQVNGLFVEAGNRQAFDTIYDSFTRAEPDFHEIVYQKKKLVMQVAMSGEINTLGFRLNVISELNRHTRDFTLNSLIKALVEVVAFFPVYRTYTRSWEVSERDRRYVDSAVARAKRRNPATDPSIFDFIRRLFLLRPDAGAGEGRRSEWLDFVMRFQQLSGPVTAKGVEDTTFYVYNRLVSLNEVGGSPERFGHSLDEFHRQNLERRRRHPLALLATSTHDTKRSEDVRARINVLSEIPERWRAALSRWRRYNRKKKLLVEGQSVPDGNEEYLLYQILLGAWPLGPLSAEAFETFRQRISDYLLKAVREAKVNSSWTRPNAAYEEALCQFVALLLQPGPDNLFLEDLRQFQAFTSHCGMLNSLSQTLLKLTAPGIPDLYQGSELWDLSLVDPDNRRPVDFAERRRRLAELQQGEAAGLLPLCRELTASMEDGRIKLHLIRQTLGLRRRQRELFEEGEYLPLVVQGERANHLCAFARSHGGRSLLVLAPRFFTRLIAQPGELPLGRPAWGETRLLLSSELAAPGYRNLLTGEVLQTQSGAGEAWLCLAEALAHSPVALLEALESWG